MILQAIEKAGINGIVAGATTCALWGQKSAVYVPYINSTAPLYALAFGVGAIGSLTGDAVHQFIKSEIHISEKAKDSASMFLGLGINGAMFAGLLYAFDPSVLRDFGVIQAFTLGAGSEFVGSASYGYLKENLYL